MNATVSKLATLGLAASLALALSACGGSKPAEDAEADAASASAEVVATSDAAEDAPAEPAGTADSDLAAMFPELAEALADPAAAVANGASVTYMYPDVHPITISLIAPESEEVLADLAKIEIGEAKEATWEEDDECFIISLNGAEYSVNFANHVTIMDGSSTTQGFAVSNADDLWAFARVLYQNEIAAWEEAGELGE